MTCHVTFSSLDSEKPHAKHNASSKIRGLYPKIFGAKNMQYLGCAVISATSHLAEMTGDQIWRDFTQLPTLIANISGTTQDIKN